MTVSDLLNNFATSLIMPSSLLQVVKQLVPNLLQQLGTSSVNTTCWRLVNRFITTCLQTCYNLCVFTCVVDCTNFKRKRSQKIDRATFCTEWKSALRERSLFMAGGGTIGTEEKCFSWENFADPTIKKSKIWLPNLKYQFKKIPTLGQKLYKRIPSSCHTCLYHFCDMSLITACEFSAV
jgi:hypothetical protein